MKWLAVLALPALLAGCAAVPENPAASAIEHAARCRVGSNGGAPVGSKAGPPVADRGIGGTGGPVPRLTERGIGGTGIVGVVSGFASVCVDGLEVALDAGRPVDIDGLPGPAAALRVGQIVAIAASTGVEGRLVASRLSVRHEVSGPVESVPAGEPGLVVVAGQRVRIPPGTALGDFTDRKAPRPGAWVAVSGTRRPDGDIEASRIDARRPGKVVVHGPLTAAGSAWAIGGLTLSTRRDQGLITGAEVAATGVYRDGTMTTETLAPDLLASDPAAYFGPGTRRLVLRSRVRFDAASATLAGGARMGLAAGFAPPTGLNGPVILSLEARPEGGFEVTGARGAPPPPVPAPPNPGASGGAAREPASGPRAADPPRDGARPDAPFVSPLDAPRAGVPGIASEPVRDGAGAAAAPAPAAGLFSRSPGGDPAASAGVPRAGGPTPAGADALEGRFPARNPIPPGALMPPGASAFPRPPVPRAGGAFGPAGGMPGRMPMGR